MPDYSLTYTSQATDGKMSGSYQISTGTKQTSQDCQFGYGRSEMAAYLTLITGLGDLITRIQKAGASPNDFSIAIIGDMPEPIDGRVYKARYRALGLLGLFDEWHLVDGLGK